MSNELLSVLEYMEKEKGISRDNMVQVIAAAVQNAAQKGVNAGQELKVTINPKTGALRAWALYKIVDSVSDTTREIHIEKAKLLMENPAIGAFYEKEVDPSLLGRIAAQTARQAIMQRLRQFEKERIFDDFKDMVGDIVSGVVRRREKGDLFIDIGKAEALLPARERVPGEEYSPGERIRCLLLEIENTARGPELILSRSHINFVRKLLELEVSEITDSTVTIEGIAREPGYRTKIAVHSKDTKVDPVGACVGARGSRIKSIVRELGGEKIDIVRYFTDPKQMLEESIKPAIPRNIRIDKENRRIYFEVADTDLAIAIGRKGQNAKLTSKLMGWRLDINKLATEGNFEKRVQRAVEGLNLIPGIKDEHASHLVAMGITSLEAFEDVTAADLVEAGFSQEDAEFIIAQVQIAQNKSTQ